MTKLSNRFLMLEVLACVLDTGSLSETSERLEISNARASRLLKELEAALEVDLVHRSTRRLSPTAAGKALARDANDMVDAWQRLLAEHSGERRENVALHIVAPVGLGQQVLVDMLFDFVLLNDGLEITIELINGAIDFYAQGCDIWIAVGPVADEKLVVREVGKLTNALVAAPSYPIARAGKHVSPADLQDAEFIALEPLYQGTIALTGTDGEAIDLTPRVRIRTNNFPSLQRATVRGLGFAVLPELFIQEDLQLRRLERLCQGWRLGTAPISIVRLPSRYRPPVLESLVESLAARIAELPGVQPSPPK